MGIIDSDWLLISILGLSMLSWGALIVISWIGAKVVGRVLRNNEELTQQIVALKNPWAMLHAQQLGSAGAEVGVDAGYQPEAQEEPI